MRTRWIVLGMLASVQVVLLLLMSTAGSWLASQVEIPRNALVAWLLAGLVAISVVVQLGITSLTTSEAPLGTNWTGMRKWFNAGSRLTVALRAATVGLPYGAVIGGVAMFATDWEPVFWLFGIVFNYEIYGVVTSALGLWILGARMPAPVRALTAAAAGVGQAATVVALAPDASGLPTLIGTTLAITIAALIPRTNTGRGVRQDLERLAELVTGKAEVASQLPPTPD